MLKVIYRERHFLDKYRCIDYTRELFAYSYWQDGISGELYYFKVDRFNYKVIGIEDTINIEEL